MAKVPPLHIIKLCVGVDSIEHLAELQKARRRKNQKYSYHYTRMMPGRAGEILAGGSMYWVIRGLIRVRQRIMALDTVHLEDRGRHCRISLHPDLIPVEPTPRKPHQGWRYFPATDVPIDLKRRKNGQPVMPPEMIAELKQLGLL